MLNNETLLFALNDAPDELLEKTRRSLRYRAQGRQTDKMRRLGRTLLIAAILTALLVGTAFAARLIGLPVFGKPRLPRKHQIRYRKTRRA